MQERLLIARKESGLTQAETAKIIGINQSSYAELEKGKTKRSTYTIELARLFDVDPYWLATGEGSRKPRISKELADILDRATDQERDRIIRVAHELVDGQEGL